MLFHITMTHTEDNCAIYHSEMMPGVLEAFENLEALGKELNVKLHYFTMCGPDHVAYVLLEADALHHRRGLNPQFTRRRIAVALHPRQLDHARPGTGSRLARLL